MNECKLSDLRMEINVEVGQDGYPLRRQLDAAAVLSWRLWHEDGPQWFWWCTNVDCQAPDRMFDFWEEAVAHVPGAVPPSPYNTLEGAGRPHKGPVGRWERFVVSHHLGQVNKRLAAEGYRQIDPSNPLDIKRYGLDVKV